MFLDLFNHPKPILAMLHLKGEGQQDIINRAILEADIYAENGVDAVIVEDYFGTAADVEAVLACLQEARPNLLVGVNVLDDFVTSYKLAKAYGANFIQVDSICGHLKPEDEKAYFEIVDSFRSDRAAAIIGGVRFKYQPYLSGRNLETDLQIGKQHCDAIAVTGSGTGVETDTEKIIRFRSILGDFPLVVGAGMTLETISEKLSHADAAIVGSTFKDTRKDTGDVAPDHVRAFMTQVQSHFR